MRPDVSNYVRVSKLTVYNPLRAASSKQLDIELSCAQIQFNELVLHKLR